ncbi:ComEC/Rec2 family competence protein [Candidatus Kaiserbacteria bacterium]|nr:ComEC/Rec2 family competence protein [Candidatus Kaiserbacteria bacterium]
MNMSVNVLWALVGGFLVGVFARSFFLVPWPFAAFLFLLSLGALALAYFERSKWQQLVVVSVALTACAAGIFRMDLASLRGAPELTSHLGETVTVEGLVVDEPDVRESNMRLHIRVGETGVLATVPPHTEVHYGDIVRAKGKLGLPENFDTTLGRQFNYPMYLAKDGIVYTLSFAQADTVAKGHSNFLRTAAIWTKQQYLKGLQVVLPEPESGLAGGITVGDKRGVGKEYSDIFIVVGLVHIIVLSGYNITVVMNLVGKLLAGASRVVQLSTSVLIVVFIVLMTGMAPSATRAGAMALLPLVARMTGRMYLALRALGVVALVMVLWNPYILAFDPGFQLSVLATLGLVLFSPVFAQWLYWIPEKFALREIAASTLGTQMTVLPLLLYQNGLLSLVALPANLLALIVVPLAMALSVISAMAGILFGLPALSAVEGFGTFIAFPAYVLLAYIIKVAELFAALPFSAVSVAAFSAWWMFGAYALMFGGLWSMKKGTTDGRAF